MQKRDLRIPLAKPDINPDDIKGVIHVLESNRLALGSHGTQFEQKLAEYVGVEFAVGVNSRTSAVHLVMCARESAPEMKLSRIRSLL